MRAFPVSLTTATLRPPKLSEKFGTIKGVRQGPDGSLYGNLYFNRAHPMAPQILEGLGSRPTRLGMSHNASGPTRREGGHEGGSALSRTSAPWTSFPSPATADSLFEGWAGIDGRWGTVDTAAARNSSVVFTPAEPSRLREIHPEHFQPLSILSDPIKVPGGFPGRVSWPPVL